VRQIVGTPAEGEHAIDIDADVDDFWPILLETLDRSFSAPASARYARVVGCTDHTSSGPRPLTEGSTIPGFRVVVAVRGSELVVQGRHRFSSYALTLRLEQISAGRSRLRAESRAEFPGWAGQAYRLLVIRTGAHVVSVRRMLSAVKRRVDQQHA